MKLLMLKIEIVWWRLRGHCLKYDEMCSSVLIVVIFTIFAGAVFGMK